MTLYVAKPMALIKALLFLGLGLSACQKPGQADPEKGQPEALSQAPGVTKLRLHRKRATMLRENLAQILNLNPQGLCLELGKMPCADVVHRSALGGMDAYRGSEYRYPSQIGVTSPMALDRLVLSACSMRANLDILNLNEALIFKGLELTIDQRIKLSPAIDEAIMRLYQRALLRQPKEYEISAIRNLYEDIFREDAVGAARQWMVLSCYAVLSSVEFLFY